MLDDYRIDTAQELFSRAVKGFKDQSVYGFENDGILVLTTDLQLLKELANIAKEKNIRFFDFGGFSLNPDQKLPRYYNNCLLFEQGEYLDSFEYGAGKTGGGETIVLSNSMTKLTKFIRPIYNKHIRDFNIDFNSQSPCVDPIVPMLYVKASINNHLLEGLNNNGCYCSKLLLRYAVEDLMSTIANAKDKRIDDQQNI